jgi:hypothetical protein
MSGPSKGRQDIERILNTLAKDYALSSQANYRLLEDCLHMEQNACAEPGYPVPHLAAAGIPSAIAMADRLTQNR